MQQLVPALVESVKVAGLVLVSDTRANSSTGASSDPSFAMPEGIDGLLKSNGVLRFNETIDM